MWIVYSVHEWTNLRTMVAYFTEYGSAQRAVNELNRRQGRCVPCLLYFTAYEGV